MRRVLAMSKFAWINNVEFTFFKKKTRFLSIFSVHSIITIMQFVFYHSHIALPFYSDKHDIISQKQVEPNNTVLIYQIYGLDETKWH